MPQLMSVESTLTTLTAGTTQRRCPAVVTYRRCPGPGAPRRQAMGIASCRLIGLHKLQTPSRCHARLPGVCLRCVCWRLCVQHFPVNNSDGARRVLCNTGDACTGRAGRANRGHGL